MSYFHHTDNRIRNTDIGLLIIRLVFGIVLIYGHGFEKLTTLLNGEDIEFANPIGIGETLSFYLATFAETVAALFFIIGWYFRWATLILTLNFIVIFVLHAFMAGDNFIILEPRFFYLFSFIAMLFTGPGKLSLDHYIHRK